MGGNPLTVFSNEVAAVDLSSAEPASSCRDVRWALSTTYLQSRTSTALIGTSFASSPATVGLRRRERSKYGDGHEIARSRGMCRPQFEQGSVGDDLGLEVDG